MKKADLFNNKTTSERLFEKLWRISEDEEPSNDIIQEVNLSALQDELLESEPIYGYDEKSKEYFVSRLSIINSVIEAFLPGYRMVAKIEEDGTIIEVYLAEV